MSRRDGPGRARWIAALLLVLVFSAGALAALAAADLGERGAEGPTAVRVEAGPMGAGGLDDLDLSDEQRQAINTLFASYQPRTDEIIETALAELRTLMDRLDGEVRGFLSPDQLETYERLRMGGIRVQAIRRTMTAGGDTIRIDTLSVDGGER